MTHAELVKRAARWLKNSFHCGVVLTELVTYARCGETPDAIGWTNNRAILVECKTSRKDFFVDQKKRARRPNAWALGHWRFYLMQHGLVRPDEIPPGWGLYEIRGKRIFHAGGIKYAKAARPPFESDRPSEVAMLVSALRRIQ